MIFLPGSPLDIYITDFKMATVHTDNSEAVVDPKRSNIVVIPVSRKPATEQTEADVAVTDVVRNLEELRVRPTSPMVLTHTFVHKGRMYSHTMDRDMHVRGIRRQPRGVVFEDFDDIPDTSRIVSASL